jgi:hypothetical protein
MIAPAGATGKEEIMLEAAERLEISEAVRIAAEVDTEYFDVLEALAK